MLPSYISKLSEVPIFPMVDILGSLDEKIEYYEKLLKDLEQYGFLLYKNLFEDKTVEKEKVSLTEIAEFYSGYSYSGEELCDKSNKGLATIKNFERNGGFKIDGYKAINISGKIKPTMYAQKGDLLVAHTDLTQNADIIGNPIILLNLASYQQIIISMDLVKVVSKTITTELLYFILKSQSFKGHALGYCSGTTVLHLSKIALNEYYFDLPTDREKISVLSDKLKVIFKRIELVIEEIQNLSKLKDLYLQKFFG